MAFSDFENDFQTWREDKFEKERAYREVVAQLISPIENADSGTSLESSIQQVYISLRQKTRVIQVNEGYLSRKTVAKTEELYSDIICAFSALTYGRYFTGLYLKTLANSAKEKAILTDVANTFGNFYANSSSLLTGINALVAKIDSWLDIYVNTDTLKSSKRDLLKVIYGTLKVIHLSKDGIGFPWIVNSVLSSVAKLIERIKSELDALQKIETSSTKFSSNFSDDEEKSEERFSATSDSDERKSADGSSATSDVVPPTEISSISPLLTSDNSHVSNTTSDLEVQSMNLSGTIPHLVLAPRPPTPQSPTRRLPPKERQASPSPLSDNAAYAFLEYTEKPDEIPPNHDVEGQNIIDKLREELKDAEDAIKELSNDNKNFYKAMHRLIFKLNIEKIQAQSNQYQHFLELHNGFLVSLSNFFAKLIRWFKSERANQVDMIVGFNAELTALINDYEKKINELDSLDINPTKEIASKDRGNDQEITKDYLAEFAALAATYSQETNETNGMDNPISQKTGATESITVPVIPSYWGAALPKEIGINPLKPTSLADSKNRHRFFGQLRDKHDEFRPYLLSTTPGTER